MAIRPVAAAVRPAGCCSTPTTASTPGSGLQPPHHVLDPAAHVLVLLVTPRRQIEPHRHQMRESSRPPARLWSLRKLRTNSEALTSSTSDSATCATTRPLAQPVAPQAAAGAAPAFLQGLVQVGLERLEGGSEPEEEPGQHGDPQGVEEDRAVDREPHPVGRAGCPPASTSSIQRIPQYAKPTPSAPPARPITTLSVRNWRMQAHPPGAEGGAHRHLPLPHRGPREQQVGHVGAGDQQDAEHRTQHGENDQVRFLPANSSRREATLPLQPVCVSGYCFGDPLDDRLHLRPRLLEARPRLQPAEHRQVAARRARLSLTKGVRGTQASSLSGTGSAAASPRPPCAPPR